MSHVVLIAADKALPPRCPLVGERRQGWDTVDMLGFSIKPFQYELSLKNSESGLRQLLAYLRENFAPGEEAELWSLWVGGGSGQLYRWRGPLVEFDGDALGMLFEKESLREDGQVCVTVEIGLSKAPFRPEAPQLIPLEWLETHDVYEFACAHRYPQNHWSPDSCYLADEAWGIGALIPELEQVFLIPRFNYYGPNRVPLDQWDQVEKLGLARRPDLAELFKNIRRWLARENKGADYFWILGP